MLRSSSARVPRTAIALLLLLLAAALPPEPSADMPVLLLLLSMYGSPVVSILWLLLDPKGSSAISSNLAASVLSLTPGSWTSGCAAAAA
jgi:hypothetical protein